MCLDALAKESITEKGLKAEAGRPSRTLLR